jgi:hypothetical protein
MSKLYFIETNGGWLTVATDEDGRACYMHEDGREDGYPDADPRWAEADAQERETIAENWLRSIAEWNSFDDLYANCDIDIQNGFCGVYTAEDFSADLENGSDEIIASIDF